MQQVTTIAEARDLLALGCHELRITYEAERGEELLEYAVQTFTTDTDDIDTFIACHNILQINLIKIK